MTRIGGEKYTKDFFVKIPLASDFSNISFEIPILNNDLVSMILTIFNAGESTDKILKINEKMSKKSSFRLKK